MTSPADRVRDLESQLEVQRKATRVYQLALERACTNLHTIGRQDIAKSLAIDAMKAVQAIPTTVQQGVTDDDDDLAG